jgi:hypothetical protein
MNDDQKEQQKFLERCVNVSNGLMMLVPNVCQANNVEEDVVIVFLHALVKRRYADIIAGKSNMPEQAAKELAAFVNENYTAIIKVKTPDDKGVTKH